MASDSHTAQTIRAYDLLLARAKQIVRSWPRISECPDERDSYPLRLYINGDQATLEWVEDSQWDSGTITYDKVFPAEMLEWTQEQFAVWAVEEERRLEAKDRKEAARYAAEREDAERAQYETLKRKFDR